MSNTELEQKLKSAVDQKALREKFNWADVVVK